MISSAEHLFPICSHFFTAYIQAGQITDVVCGECRFSGVIRPVMVVLCLLFGTLRCSEFPIVKYFLSAIDAYANESLWHLSVFMKQNINLTHLLMLYYLLFSV